MANFRTVLAANTTGTKLCTITKPRALTEWFASLNAYGTFGSGTLSYAVSTDNGVTLVPLQNAWGTYSTVSGSSINMSYGVANQNGKEPVLYAILAGATSPSITIDVMDNT